METNEPHALADISVCDDVVTLAEAVIADASWTGAQDDRRMGRQGAG